LIALEFVDKVFEACPQLQFWIFNKRVLLPLTQLPLHLDYPRARAPHEMGTTLYDLPWASR